MKNKTQIAAAVSLVFLIALCVALKAQDRNADAVAIITELINEDVKAAIAGDTNFVKTHYADSYIEGTSLGTWITKAQFLDASQNRVNSRKVGDVKVSVFGDTAIARFRETYDAMVEGQHHNRTIICTQTWNKQDVGWEMLATHCSKVR